MGFGRGVIPSRDAMARSQNMKSATFSKENDMSSSLMATSREWGVELPDPGRKTPGGSGEKPGEDRDLSGYSVTQASLQSIPFLQGN